MLEYVLELNQWKLLGGCLLYACLLDAVCMEWRSSECLRNAMAQSLLHAHSCARMLM